LENLNIKNNAMPMIVDAPVKNQKAKAAPVPGMPPTFTPKSPVKKLRGRKMAATIERT
jgi:hypothetical protein